LKPEHHISGFKGWNRVLSSYEYASTECNLYSPAGDEAEKRVVVLRDVAAQVEFETIFETRKSLDRKSLEIRRFQAMGQLAPPRREVAPLGQVARLQDVREVKGVPVPVNRHALARRRRSALPETKVLIQQPRRRVVASLPGGVTRLSLDWYMDPRAGLAVFSVAVF
jgi:hypothetical protein